VALGQELALGLSEEVVVVAKIRLSNLE